MKTFNYLYFIFLSLLAYFLYHHNVLNADEGVVLNNAWHMLNGYRLYHDLFEMVAPASFYLIYLVFFIFGASYQVAIIFSILFLVLGSYGLYLIMKIFNKNSLYNYLVPLIFICSLGNLNPVINHNVFFSIIIIWLIYYLLAYFKKNKLYLLIIAGALTGVSILFLQHKGLLVLFFNLIFLFFYFKIFKGQQIQKFLIYLSTSLVPIVALFLFWPARLLWEQLIVFPFFNYWEVNKTSLNFFIFCFLILLALFLLEKRKSIYIKYLFFIQTALLLSSYTQPGHYHLVLVFFPALIISAVYCNKFKTRVSKTIFIILIIFNLLLFRPLNQKINFKNSDWHQTIENNCKHEYIYVGPFLPNLYLELNKINVTQYNYLTENQSLFEHFEQGKKRFIENEPDCAVLFYYQNIKTKFRHTGDNILEEYIRLNYNEIYNDGVVYIYHKTHE